MQNTLHALQSRGRESSSVARQWQDVDVMEHDSVTFVLLVKYLKNWAAGGAPAWRFWPTGFDSWSCWLDVGIVTTVTNNESCPMCLSLQTSESPRLVCRYTRHARQKATTGVTLVLYHLRGLICGPKIRGLICKVIQWMDVKYASDYTKSVIVHLCYKDRRKVKSYERGIASCQSTSIWGGERCWVLNVTTVLGSLFSANLLILLGDVACSKMQIESIWVWLLRLSSGI